jgi:very-short-patch-repair endonuclease
MTFEAYVRRQAGVISREQALAAGFSRDQIDRRLAGGTWLPMHRAVYLVAGFRRTDEARMRAASLWAGPNAHLHGASAAWWHGMLGRLPETISFTVPRRYRRRSPPPGIVVRRRTLPAADMAIRLDVLVVAGPLAALEAAVELGAGGAEFLDRALQRYVRFPALYRAYTRNLGAEGSSAASKLLVAAADGAAAASERLLVRLLRSAGVRGWTLGHPVEPYLIDVAFPARRVAVEVDGWAWHVDVARFRADRRRQNALVAGGWTVLRFTWHDLVDRPDEDVGEIVDILRAETPRHRSA